MINRHILIDGVQVKDCVAAIRTANRDFGHDGLTIRNVSGEDFREDDRWRPLNVRNTRNLLIENVRISGGPANAPWLVVENSDNVTIRNITLVDANHEGPAVVVEDADHALIDNVVFTGQSRPDRAIEYRVRADERFGGLRIRNVVASGTKSAGIAPFEPEQVRHPGFLCHYGQHGNGKGGFGGKVPHRRGQPVEPASGPRDRARFHPRSEATQLSEIS